MRKKYTWQLPGTSIELGERTVVMGILNVTPDSFSDGGLYDEPDRAVERALEIEAEGADILDIGGESTRPGSEAVSEPIESQRVLPIIARLALVLKIPISIDTYRSNVARQAIDAGAQIINDISGFRLDPTMNEVARTTRAGVVLMHSRGGRDELFVRPQIDSPETVRNELAETIAHAVDGGVDPRAVVADPGLAFSKTHPMSLKVLKKLHIFSKLGYPLLVGASRKSFIREDISVSEAAVWGTAGAVAIAASNGAHIVRVHDVAQMRVVVKIADRVKQS